ncbi:LysR family transcriptional regulator [Deinococcus sp. KSM4-11]|uniref:LysR family transcriptional regulator n=1 Tax=Deinococcus sp. KSM4-11 TaxID=2568654 RepID=UPI0010A4D243|nr:LysR family transcriptional regulator [Deinococcus sp. KSM4-11]THF87777.1 LysR family transcriptional regulator [Deinococcus sp. KSM4-11]
MATGKSTTLTQPTLPQLRALLAVADAGGFGEAAAELGVSQSSLSEAVGKLEDLVGRPLLRRSPAGTVVTPAGARVLAHARTAVQAAADVLLAAQDEGGLSGVLRVASFRSTATHLLPPVLAAFRREHPGVTVRLLDGEADGGGEAQVRDGQADIALVVGEDMPGLRLTPLLDDEYLFVAPEARGNQPVTFEEVAGSALLLPPGLNSCHVRVQSYLRPLGISPAAVTEIDQDSVILGMVRHGLGVTVMPRLALLPLPDGLVALPLPQSLTRPLAVATLPQRAHLPIIRQFTAALVASLGMPDTRPAGAWRAAAPLLH